MKYTRYHQIPLLGIHEKNPHAFYARVNLGEVGCSRDIVKRSVRIIRIQRLNRPEPGCLQIGRKKHMDKHDLINQLQLDTMAEHFEKAISQAADALQEKGYKNAGTIRNKILETSGYRYL